MSESWIAVASAEHVQHDRATGFMQVCHGKATGLSSFGLVFSRCQATTWT